MRHWTLPLIFLLFFAGCARLPLDEARCTILETPSLDTSVLQALKTHSVKTGEFPPADWWQIFADPQLNALIQIALDKSPTLQKAEAALQRAEAEAKIQKSRLFPTIGFSAEIDWEYLSKNGLFRAFTPVIPGNITETELGLDFSYELDFWGKNRNIFRAALGEAKAKKAELAQTTLLLSLAVAMSYFRLQELLAREQLFKEERALLLQMLKLTQMRKKHAIDTQTQELNSEERLLQINQNILFTEKEIAIEKHLLWTLTAQGIDECAEITQKPLLFTRAFPLPEKISCDLLARRPDLMTHIWRIEAMAHLVGAAKADFYPSVNLAAFAGFDSLFFSKLFKWQSRTGYVEPALHLPIFTGGRLRGNLREKQAQFHEAIAAYNELILVATQQVADGLVSLTTVDKQLRLQTAVVQTEKQKYGLSLSRYEHALNNAAQVLAAQKNIIEKKLTELQLRFEKFRSLLSLIRALGGGYENHSPTFLTEGQ